MKYVMGCAGNILKTMLLWFLEWGGGWGSAEPQKWLDDRWCWEKFVCEVENDLKIIKLLSFSHLFLTFSFVLDFDQAEQFF